MILGLIVATYVNRDLIRIRIASVYVPAPPKADYRPDSRARHTGATFFPQAPWALSALPECLTQTSVTRGDIAFVRAHLPKTLAAVAAPATLRYADCTIVVRANDAVVERGLDRFHIPPRARFYAKPGELALLRTQGARAELRTYSPSKP
ncbi:MAG TPA: hypothetical protein VIG32_09865 [Candidatus Baltobacteraceae bacterium]